MGTSQDQETEQFWMLLEHLMVSGTKITMSGPIALLWEQRYIETIKQTKIPE